MLSSFVDVKVLAEAYYVSVNKPSEIVEVELSTEIPYNVSDFIESYSGFDWMSCNTECARKCKELREEGKLQQITQEEVDEAAANGEVILEGLCYYKIEDGLENTMQNRRLICGCDPYL